MQDAFTKKIIAMRGEEGRQWLAGLPGMIKTYETKWSIKVFSPFPLSYNYVAPAETSEGKAVVLKISFPDNHEFAPEVRALQLFPQEACIRVIQEDLQNGAVLLEQAIPGTRFRAVASDEEQVAIAAQVVSRLHRPIAPEHAGKFPTIAKWAQAFERYRKTYASGGGFVPKRVLDSGDGIFREFFEEKRPQILLHGDLHTDNILLSGRGWVVIDPKGVVGESEFELGAFLRNPIYDFPEGTDYKKAETRRIVQFADALRFDRQRIKNWAFASSVISLLWLLEDEGKRAEKHKNMYLRNAELLRELQV